jgi:hypothetical protein
MRWLYWLLPVIAVSACRDPTQVSVAISTDLDCSAHLSTAIAEGAPAEVSRAVASATTDACASGGDIGTLVFVPSHGRNDRFAVQVVMAVGVPLESCVPPAFGANCIVATRSLHYIPHTSLMLPIVMRSACRGVLCSDGLTCSNGVCTTAEIDPFACTEPGGCTEPPPPPMPIDAAAPPSDDASIVDAGDAATPLPDAAVPPSTVVTGRRLIASVTSDAANVYWTEPGDYSMANGGVYRSDASGAVTTITSTRESPSVVVVDGSAVFWAELLGAGIVRAPIGGGAATALPVTGGFGTNMTDIAVDGAFVYWNNESVGALDGLVRRSSKDGSGAITLAQGIKKGPWRIAVGSTSVAFVTASQFGGTGAVSTIPKSGGTPVVISALTASAPSARVAISSDRIAWATVDNGGSVMARTAGAVSALATGQGEIASLTASATAVYWVHGAAGGPASLERAAWSGGARKLAGGIAVAGPLTVNATDVYFVDNKLGEIRRVSN